MPLITLLRLLGRSSLRTGRCRLGNRRKTRKLMHYRKHPNYVYIPLNRAVKRAQKKASKTATTSKDAKRPVKKHRSPFSQCSRKAESLRFKSRLSLRDNAGSESVFVLLDEETDGESQQRVDVQFGDVASTQLPPPPTDTNSPCEVTSSDSSLLELSTSSDTPLYHTGYPNWMFNELLGYGTPDTGLHVPLQTTLNSYGDNYFDHGDQLLPTGNELGEFSRYVNYDNVDTTTTTASDSKETTGADTAFTSFPSLDYDGNLLCV